MARVSFASCVALAVGQVQHPIRHSMVDRINARNGGWEAMSPEENPLAKLSYDEIKGLMGLVMKNQSAEHSATTLSVGSIPDAFDGRTKFSSCQKAIRDQASCGSCWAFGAAETLTTNLCVLGQDVPVLSPQDLISCDASDHGCNGGTLLNAWSLSTTVAWFPMTVCHTLPQTAMSLPVLLAVAVPLDRPPSTSARWHIQCWTMMNRFRQQ